GGLEPGPDHDSVHATLDRPQVEIAPIALDLGSVRVHREDLVPPLPQALVHDVAAVALGVPGDPGHRDSPAGQKLGCSLLNVHDASFLLWRDLAAAAAVAGRPMPTRPPRST